MTSFKSSKHTHTPPSRIVPHLIAFRTNGIESNIKKKRGHCSELKSILIVNKNKKFKIELKTRIIPVNVKRKLNKTITKFRCIHAYVAKYFMFISTIQIKRDQIKSMHSR